MIHLLRTIKIVLLRNKQIISPSISLAEEPAFVSRTNQFVSISTWRERSRNSSEQGTYIRNDSVSVPKQFVWRRRVKLEEK